jgi:starch synthase
MIGMVSRLVAHKGLDMVKSVFEELLQERVQIVILGTGDAYYEGFFKDLEYRYSHKLKTIIAFNQDLSRKIYASSDIFLMPSIAEPCGLSQMIASRYGSIPLVRRTGGLADSIVDFTAKGNGYTFDNIDSNEMYTVFKRALADYSNQEEWGNKVKKVMSVDFGWTKSAKEYLKMYDDVLNK